MYKIRHDLSVMEWNEHVYRPFTSTNKVDHTKWNWVVEKDGTRKRSFCKLHNGLPFNSDRR